MNLTELLKKIQSSTEDARFTEWMSLYRTSLDENGDEGIGLILKWGDPVLKILLARFLAQISEEKSVLWLSRLLMDSNEVVTEAARKSFDKNRYSSKVQTLLPVLQAPIRASVFFAMEHLSLAGVTEAIDPLLAMLKEADEEMLLSILAALRQLPHRDLIPYIDPFLIDARESVRFRSILIIASIHNLGLRGSRKKLIASLGDESARIRKAAVWGLGRRYSLFNRKVFLKLSESDRDPSVRSESLNALIKFPDPQVIRHLLVQIDRDADQYVVLKGESVLLSMPRRRVVRGIKKVLSGRDKKLHRRALLLVSLFQKESKSYFRYLKRGLKKAQTDVERMSYIEALGHLEHEAVPDLVYPYLEDSPLVTYAATMAINRHWGRRQDKSILNLLARPKISALTRQMILMAILKKMPAFLKEPGMIALFIPYLRSENLNIRYLAAQILARSSAKVPLDLLVETILVETDHESFKVFKSLIQKMIMIDPNVAVQLLKKTNEEDRAEIVGLLLTILETTNLNAVQILTLLPLLLFEPLKLISTPYLHLVAGLTLKWLYAHIVPLSALYEILEKYRGSDDFFHELLSLMRAQGTDEIEFPSLRMMKHFLEVSEPSTRVSMIELLGLSKVEGAASVLAGIFVDEKQAQYRPHISKALSYMMQST